jgi:DNA-damage-inducible protein J
VFKRLTYKGLTGHRPIQWLTLDSVEIVVERSYNVAMKNAVIRARIEARLKADACSVLASCGLEPSDAIRLFLQQVVARRALPFEIRAADPDRSLAEMKRQAQERDHRIAAEVDVSDGRMLLLKPEKLRKAKVYWPDASLV